MDLKEAIDLAARGKLGAGEDVAKGQCVSSIAFGKEMFWKKIWMDAANVDLRKARINPTILLEGDKLTIPQKEPDVLDENPNSKYRYKRKGIPCGLQLRFTKFGKPRKGESFEVWHDVLKIGEGQLTDDGQLVVDMIQPDWDSITVFIGDKREVFEFELGTISPITEPRGIQARLWNLGYYNGELTDEFSEETENALRRFLQKHGLLDDLDYDFSTQSPDDLKMYVKYYLSLLVSVHGC